MKAAFADSFFFLALLDRRDQHHGEAIRFARSLAQPIVTTRWVLAEVANSIASTHLRGAVRDWIEDLELDPLATIVGPSDDLFQRGLRLYASRADKSWSLTDCISFVVMGDLDLEEALTGDHHFAQAGFRAVFAE